jgi:hypothetical protein
MCKAKTGVLVFGAVLALSAIAVAPALAESWFVNGTQLASGATAAIASTAKVDESSSFTVPSLGVRLTCSGQSISEQGAYIQAPAGGFAKSTVFGDCSEISPANCTIETNIALEGTEVITQKIRGEILLLWTAPKGVVNVGFKGACALAGEQKFDGTVAVGMPSGAVELAAQPEVGLGTTENNSLELLSRKGYLVGGRALLKLASGQSWSFR